MNSSGLSRSVLTTTTTISWVAGPGCSLGLRLGLAAGSGGAAGVCAGAAGVFQMMPASAREHGLKLWPRDQRRQPVPEARAAARELRELHDQFGDWRLAVAAYNCGAGTVQKSLDRHHAKSYELIATHLPAETQMYVPKVEATILHREGVELEQLKAPAAPAHG